MSICDSMDVNFKRLGDRAILIQLESRIDVQINRNTLRLYHDLTQQKLPGIEFLTPGFCSITVGFDSDQLTKDQVCGWVSEITAGLSTRSVQPANQIRVPVCYDLDLAWDLVEVAAEVGLTTDQVVEIHQQPVYHTYMLGFLPGFAYLGTVAPKIQVRRKSVPRMQVPAGAVAMAGPQTGIYPFQAPGGWQIIGRTPMRVFQASSQPKASIQPGDQVTFYPIDRPTFDSMLAAEDAR